jgi:Protein of unknown function (DUF1572)
MNHALDERERLSAVGANFLTEAREQLNDFGGTINHCVMQLDDSQIWWRPRPKMNSVGNLALHLAGNMRQRILSDIGGEPSARDRFAEFTERRLIPRQELLRLLGDTLGRVDAALQVLPAERLPERLKYDVAAGTLEGTVQGLIVRALTHFAGHTQEILFMTRLQLSECYAFKNPAGVPPSMRSGSTE